MLSCLDEFRKLLSGAMLSSMDKRVVLYGYGYTGRFLRWYAKYYHGIDIDYVITEDWPSSIPYDQELFRPTLFAFGYKDVADCMIWLAAPYTGELSLTLERSGYDNSQIVDFYDLVYGDDIYWLDVKTDAFHQRKTGLRDIQFMEWLEWKYDCNFVTRVNNTEFHDVNAAQGASFVAFTQKEIFEILDKIHYRPTQKDAAFDFGCGKGGAMLSFLDYGFSRVGGVEYETGLYEVLTENLTNLGLQDKASIRVIHGDASLLEDELDDYNWMYMASPFYGELFQKCIDHIAESIKRKPRKVHLIYINPHEHQRIEENGCFRLCNQFTFTSRQRVVKVYESLTE